MRCGYERHGGGKPLHRGEEWVGGGEEAELNPTSSGWSAEGCRPLTSHSLVFCVSSMQTVMSITSSTNPRIPSLLATISSPSSSSPSTQSLPRPLKKLLGSANPSVPKICGPSWKASDSAGLAPRSGVLASIYPIHQYLSYGMGVGRLRTGSGKVPLGAGYRPISIPPCPSTVGL